MPYTLKELAAIMNAKFRGDSSYIIDNQLFDSRNILQTENSLFWAFQGKVDGHQFIHEVYKKGVRAFISYMDIPNLPEDANLLIIDNTHKALQQLAAYHIRKYSLQTIGITGSNGKTVVKEWLFQSLSDSYKIVRSPKSYNSQIGLPFSLLQTNAQHQIGIFEFGISQAEEMSKLQVILQPDIGVLTNVRESHLENFESFEHLVMEKLSLFKDTPKLVYNVDLQRFVKNEEYDSTISFGGSGADVFIDFIETKEMGSEIRVNIKGETLNLNLPFSDKASLENLQAVIGTLYIQGFSLNDIQSKIADLQPIEMRLEKKNGLNNSIILRDEFSLDYSSLEIALNVLNQQIKDRKIVILSDFDTIQVDENHKLRLISLLNSEPLDEIHFIGNQFQNIKNQLDAKIYFYKTTEELYSQISSIDISESAVLIKGARKFGLEKVSESLMDSVHETILEVSLENLISNYNYFRKTLKPKTKIMAMVKANAYGLGIEEISKTLQHHSVNYLGVAYTDEGVTLRKSGIRKPIMVMNPETSGFEEIIKYNLEPEIYSFRVLKEFIQHLRRQSISHPYPIHIKIDTGMHRLGFQTNQIQKLASILKNKDEINVVSVFSHLSVADIPEDTNFTLNQIHIFEKAYKKLTKDWKMLPMKHILNTAGVIYYPEYQFDMVRIGIGLYDSCKQPELNIVAQFKTIISQIKKIKKGDSVSYGRKFIADRDMKIGILPVGYADGVSRHIFPNQYQVRVNNRYMCKVIGVICMDMMMIDVNNTDCKEGDEVVIFGKDPKLADYANASDTITYECLTSISPRIKRIYFN